MKAKQSKTKHCESCFVLVRNFIEYNDFNVFGDRPKSIDNFQGYKTRRYKFFAT